MTRFSHGMGGDLGFKYEDLARWLEEDKILTDQLPVSQAVLMTRGLMLTWFWRNEA
jgi:hypothetical protein